jgi:predicted dienelactone hydrolase
MRSDPVFDDVLGTLPPDLLDLLGGRLYEVGYQDGVLADLSRNRQIRYRVRYPKGFSGPAAVILLSQGGLGDELGHTDFPHFGTAFARLGFLAANIGHQPSAGEARHRYDRPLDVSFVIDALARTAAAARGTPYDAEEAMPLPENFTGVPERAWLGHQRLLPPSAPPPAFAAAPDVDHIGVLGHSYGAFTAHAVGGVEHSPTMGIRDFRDPRVDAVVLIAPQGQDRYGCFDKGPGNNSWAGVVIPAYVLLGEHDLVEWRRQPFDRYPPVGDKFLTIGKGQTHADIAGYGPAEVRRLLDLNTALFFHTYLRGGTGRDSIGTLAWLDGWTLERKLDPTTGSGCS